MQRVGMAVLIAGLAAAGPALAVELSDISENLPLTIEDATPIRQGQLAVEGAVVYERQSGDDLFTVLPRVNYGVARNLELSAALPYSLGDGEEADSGELRIGAQYQFVQEAGRMPAMAVTVRLAQGIGDDAGDTAVDVGLLASKRLGQSQQAPKLHLNLGWRHDFDSAAGEEENRRTIALGASKPVSQNFAVLADLVWEEQRLVDEEAFLLEVGGRYRLASQMVVTAGVGAGLDSDSPDLRMTVGLQQSF